MAVRLLAHWLSFGPPLLLATFPAAALLKMPSEDRKALSEVICQYSSMIIDLKDEIAESDANPVLVYEVGAGLKVVDARIILKKK